MRSLGVFDDEGDDVGTFFISDGRRRLRGTTDAGTQYQLGRTVLLEGRAMSAPIFATDPSATGARRSALAAYYEQEVLDHERDFVCSSFDGCRTSAARSRSAYNEGQLPHVGEHYDATIDGHPSRVMIVPMETWAPDYRRQPMASFTAAVHRHAANPRGRNPHMRGVMFALQLTFGLPASTARADEYLSTPDGPVHLYDTYVHHNATLCAALKTDATGKPTTKSAQTSIMRRNCFRHLATAIEILEPTLVIAQGATVGNALVRTFSIEQWHTETVARCTVRGHRFTWVKLPHPSAHPPQRWASLKNSFLHEVVAPSIGLARKLASPER